MVQIRTYERQQVERAFSPTQRRAPTTAAGELARGLSDVGQAAWNAQDEIDTAEAKNADARFSNMLREELYGDENGYLYAQGGDAVQRRESVAERINSIYEASYSGLSRGAREHAQAAMEARRQRALQNIDQHAQGERLTYLNSAADARIAASVNDAIHDPTMAATALATSAQEIRDKGDRLGWAPEVTEAAIREAASSIHVGTVDRLAARNPAAALEYLEANRDQIDAGALAQLESQVIPRAKDRMGRDLAAAAMAGGGVSDTYLASIRSAESGGNDAAKNPNSSATGRYQFTAGTWLDMMRKHPELGLTATGRLDPAQQEKAIRAFTADNAKILSAKGISATNANLYAAHFLGAGAAPAAILADASAPMESIVSPAVIEANPFLRGMSAGEFRAWTERKAGAGTGYSPNEPGDPLDRIMSIEDQDVRDAALREYSTLQGVQEKQRQQAQTTAATAVSNHIIAGGSVYDLSPQQLSAIGPDGFQALRRFEEAKRAGRPIRTDDTLYVELHDMMANTPEAFMSADPAEWRDRLDDADFQYFVKQRTAMQSSANAKPDGVDPMGFSEVRTATSTIMEGSGLLKKDNARAYATMESQMLRWAQGFTAKEQRAPTPVEVTEQAQKYLVPIVLNPQGFNNQMSGLAVEIEFDNGTLTDLTDDITLEQMEDLAGLTIAGVEVPPTVVREFIVKFTRTMGRAPQPREVLMGLIDSGEYRSE